MMDADEASIWMLEQIKRDSCLYHDDVVDYLLKAKAEHLLRENADGNLAVATGLLKAFKELTEATIVWVKPDRYWRYRVDEDKPGREARG